MHAHSPSLRFNTSLTACGLALPPDAFIAWPTNHPIAFGLLLASATFSGFLAMFLDMDAEFNGKNGAGWEIGMMLFTPPFFPAGKK